MKKVSWILFFVLTGALIFTPANRLWGQGGIPQTATFADGLTDMIRSDGSGPYQNNVDCVTSLGIGGLYFLRTVQQSCTPTRTLVLDFSNPVTGQGPSSCAGLSDPDTLLTLNPCGPNPTIPDVRFAASTLLRPSATSSTVGLVINLKRDFHENDFELVFLNPICMTSLGSGVLDTTKTCTANPNADDEATLYRINEATGALTLIGTYHMPFQVTVTAQ